MPRYHGITSKYRAIPTTLNGYRFASRKEAGRYSELLLMERSGLITGLELQPKFPLVVNGIKVCVIIPDFQYRDSNTRKIVIEDTKGFRTDVYRIKKKLFEALYAPLTITEL